MKLHDQVVQFCDRWGPDTGPTPKYKKFVDELRAVMTAYALEAIKRGRLPDGDDMPKGSRAGAKKQDA